MSHHLDRLDLPTEIFIWDEIGVYSAASAEEQARIRSEDKHIYVAAALEHPWMQAKAIVRNTLRQLSLFTLHEYSIPSAAEYTQSKMTLTMADSGTGLCQWQTVMSLPVYLVVWAGLGYRVRAWRGGLLTREQLDFLALILGTVVIEALAGAFSEPAPRYEARVVWLLPMAALLLSYTSSARRRS